MEGGKPLMSALKERYSTKEFSPQPIFKEMLSDLLWAALGINRPDSGKRTAPSAGNSQEITIYVLMVEGVYLFDAKAHSLIPMLAQDLRSLTAGPQDYAKNAPVHLLYVADYTKMDDRMGPKKPFFAACDTGMICQNVNLYCASAGLGAVVRGTMDIPGLQEKLKLRSDQEIMLNQLIGYPKK
jgi:SagB-type dehydrogenase family enzyme